MKTKSAKEIIAQSKKMMKELREQKSRQINGGVLIMTDYQRKRHKYTLNTCIRYIGNIARSFGKDGLTGIIDIQVPAAVYTGKEATK